MALPLSPRPQGLPLPRSAPLPAMPGGGANSPSPLGGGPRYAGCWGGGPPPLSGLAGASALFSARLASKSFCALSCCSSFSYFSASLFSACRNHRNFSGLPHSQSCSLWSSAETAAGSCLISVHAMLAKADVHPTQQTSVINLWQAREPTM